ncbi:MAG: FliI/YscN family ATPase, partial [Clostridia bacterium]|nr:FliI/YscN family ATPase [Clostridia bacterium]
MSENKFYHAGTNYFAPYYAAIKQACLIQQTGIVTKVVGLTIEAEGIKAAVGEICRIFSEESSRFSLAEVMGFRAETTILMPLGSLEGVKPGSRIHATGKPLQIKAGQALLGRVVDGLGQPIDGHRFSGVEINVNNNPPHPLERKPIATVLETGVKAIDCFLTCGEGQRIGIFAGSGVGKSTLLGMIARSQGVDVNVIALVGERGREVKDFIQQDLGPVGLKKSVLVVATSDQPALVRVKAAFVATAIAEYFRDLGKSVMLMMDSVTRFALAQREIGLAVGEPPTTRGYTPSVFALLPRLLERAGAGKKGSITALYTVLVEGDDMNEPIADAVRGILDGHIVLTRELAQANHFPAIDILQSVSRLINRITSP